jgi:hypothetical protein
MKAAVVLSMLLAALAMAMDEPEVKEALSWGEEEDFGMDDLDLSEHPFYHNHVLDDEEEAEEEERMLKSSCSNWLIAIKPSEFKLVRKRKAKIVYGKTPAYSSLEEAKWGNTTASWHWEYVDSGTYGTMMLSLNSMESIYIGFHNSQLFYPIAVSELFTLGISLSPIPYTLFYQPERLADRQSLPSWIRSLQEEPEEPSMVCSPRMQRMLTVQNARDQPPLSRNR